MTCGGKFLFGVGRGYRDEFSVPFMWFRLYYPGMEPELALETIRMFGEEVIPLCREAGERHKPAAV